MFRLRHSPVAWFLLRFVAIYGLLIAPWPGWNAHYAGWMADFGSTLLSPLNNRWIVRFETEARTPARPLDLRIIVANPDRVTASGNAPAVVLELDARGIGWVPTALLIALILATPLPWSRRLGALLGGLAAIHALILFSIGIHLLSHSDASSGLSLVTLSPWGKMVADGLDETLITQLSPGLVCAVLLWVLVSFRRTDWRLLWAASRKNVPDR